MFDKTAAGAFFDRVAGEYDEAIPFFATCGRRLVDWLNPAHGAMVVDVGAGRGAVSLAAVDRGCRVTAVDASPHMIELLSAARPQVTAAVMDAEDLDLPPGAFDLATAGFLVHLVARPDRMLRCVHRVLHPGGTVGLSLFDPSGDGPQWAASLRLMGDYWRYADPAVRPPWRSVDPGALLASAGFVDIETLSTTVEVALPDPDAFWRWNLSNGQRVLIEALPADRGRELRRLLHREVSAMDPMVYQRGVAFWSARVPT
jgi:SAM-dependent methyltransferase